MTSERDLRSLSFKCRKNGEYSLVMTPTPYRLAGCIVYVLVHLLSYLLTYIVGSGRTKPAISPKRLKIERKLLLTVCIKSCTGFRLPPKCMNLNDLCARFKVIDSLNTAKMAKYGLAMTPTLCRVAGRIISVRRTAYIGALVHFTQLARGV